MPSDPHAQAHATVDDLYRTPGKAELISGKIVRFPADGYKPNRVACRIFRSLDDFAARVGKGEAFVRPLGFAIPELPSGRESFSPDAAHHDGPHPKNLMRFIEGPPTFAVEVRSENDYENAAEVETDDKRRDYFAAAAQAGWDVDPLAETDHVYKAAAPNRPIIYGRGDTAKAEPAVPAWTVAVDWIFS